MRPDDVAPICRRLFAPLAALLAVTLAPRECEIAAGFLIIVVAGKMAGEAIRARPGSFDRWAPAWFAALFGMSGLALLGWGFFPATFLVAGYASVTLLLLAARCDKDVWSDEPSAGSIRLVVACCGLLLGGYATAGGLGWSPEFDVRPLVVVPAGAAVVMTALFALACGLELCAQRSALAAVGLYALAGGIVFAGAVFLPALAVR